MILDRSSQVQCQADGGYPAVSNISMVIKERDEKCGLNVENVVVHFDGTYDCFNVVKELQVNKTPNPKEM